jgi:hypothetical protein
MEKTGKIATLCGSGGIRLVGTTVKTLIWRV